MDPLSRHHRRRPSSDRFLTTFSPPTTTPSVISTTDDFDEDDVFFTTSPFSPTTTTKTTTVSSPKPPTLRTQRSFKLEPSGILAALPEPPLSPSLSIFNHKLRQPSADSTTVTTTTATISARNIPILPRTSATTAKYAASSAPIHVPMMPISKGRRSQQRRLQGSAFGFEDIDDSGDGGGGDNDDDEMMLPPHEMVARRLAETPVVSCSVLEGAGRTLKGRDLRQVRNAVFRHTGFID